jgi:hypothetical protein
MLSAFFADCCPCRYPCRWSLEPCQLGQVAPRPGEDGFWVGEVAECTSLLLATQSENSA